MESDSTPTLLEMWWVIEQSHTPIEELQDDVKRLVLTHVDRPLLM